MTRTVESTKYNEAIVHDGKKSQSTKCYIMNQCILTRNCQDNKQC